MSAKAAAWELLILDAAPPVSNLGSLAVGDVDGDGRVELVTGGQGALLWYRPETFERGVIAEGGFGVGLALGDVDGDGRLEVVAGESDPAAIVWFKPGPDLHEPWPRHVMDSLPSASAHDIIFADLDDDGQDEVIANAMSEAPGLFGYKANSDVAAPWRKHAIAVGIFTEGLAAGDLDGDGRTEIVHGPDWFACPADGPFSGPWERRVFAPGFREMCRTALVDITGNGRLDIVIAESEYPDGRLSWFENRLLDSPDGPWLEHPLDRPVNFAHSLAVGHDPECAGAHILLAEMAKGGWDAPYNWDGRLIEYRTEDGGRTWRRDVVYEGAGTHQATRADVDGDGAHEIVGKEWGQAFTIPRVQIWRRRKEASPLDRFRHCLLDRDKPSVATDILAVDVNGDGRPDVVCGAWWYANPSWQRHEIPGISQAVNAFDLDGDGRQELIATEGPGLTSEFCWLRPVDPEGGKWEQHAIGTGSGDWPHGTAMAPLLPNGGLALVAGYHSAGGRSDVPEIFEVPEDPKSHPWPKRVLADVPYGEELVPYDLDGDGQLDLVVGPYWLENLGDGTFTPHLLVDQFEAARVRVADVNGDGRPDVVLGEEVLDFQAQFTPFSRLAWLEQPEDPRCEPWQAHVIDKLRCPHSLDVGDLDGDGELELVCGEHDPFQPYRSRCRLYVYKKADPHGTAWLRYTLDDRFEHHDGSKIVELAPSRMGIISHGWKDTRYVHLWEAH